MKVGIVNASTADLQKSLRAEDHLPKAGLVGRKVTGARLMTNQELHELGWHLRKNEPPPLVLEFEGGVRLHAAADTEGNGPGDLVAWDTEGFEFPLKVGG